MGRGLTRLAIATGIGAGVVGCGSGATPPSGFDKAGQPTAAVSSVANNVAIDLSDRDAAGLASLAVPPAEADAQVTLAHLGGHPTSILSIVPGVTDWDLAVTFEVHCSANRGVDVLMPMYWQARRWRVELYGPPPSPATTPNGSTARTAGSQVAEAIPSCS